MSTVTHTSGPARSDTAPPDRPPVDRRDVGNGFGGRIFNGFSHLFLAVWAIMVSTRCCGW